MEKDFSIIIPTYNDLDIFKISLHSVMRQKDVSIEIIIVDDSDNNCDIQNYISSIDDQRIRYIHNSHSLGAVPNWNKGLCLASGHNIVIMHHDESFSSADELCMIKKCLCKYDVVVSNIIVNNGAKEYVLASNYIKQFFIQHPTLLFFANVIGPCATVAFKRRVMPLFDDSLKWFVDVEWYYRMFRTHKVTYLPSSVIVSRHGHQGQISKTIDVMTEAKKDAKVLGNKYPTKFVLRFAMWLHINVLHNNCLQSLLKKIARR